MSTFNNRINTYATISTELALLSNLSLLRLIEKAPVVHSGIGGGAVLLNIKGIPIFVKLIPLTDLEYRQENIMSTANLFKLPLYYQYGVGSAGFGAWRELFTHVMSTNWVLSGRSENFPLMYHWRILPTFHDKFSARKDLEDVEKSVHYWNDSFAVRNRLEEINKSSTNIVIFLEHIPFNLQTWLAEKLQQKKDIVDEAICMVNNQISNAIKFMNSQNMLHFDAHFRNILTDGSLLYFSDFGLALYEGFSLSQDEINFFEIHQNYDKCSALIAFVHTIITSIYGKENLEIFLCEYANNQVKYELTPTLSEILKQYTPIACVMDNFYRKLQHESKLTPYPKTELDILLRQVKWD